MALLAFLLVVALIFIGISLAALYVAFWIAVIMAGIVIAICFALLTAILGHENIQLAAVLAVPLGLGILILIGKLRESKKKANTQHG